jgi:CDP-glucose 4,6-dehydratase
MSVTDAYRGRRVLVTGLTGFKGLWLSTWLERLGAVVTGLALPPEPAVLRGWPGLAEHFPCTHADVRDFAAVRRAFDAVRPEVVFHLAAQPLVRRSYREPVETFATNVLGTVHVLEAARRTATVRAVVNVTSDKCYENREWLWGYREDEAFGGHDPYSASKGCAEVVTAAYRRSYSLPLASARAGNVIGGGDWAADRLVPDLVRAILAGEPVLLRRPGSIRPWQHVAEPLSGYLLLGERLLNSGLDYASGWNFGPSDLRPLTVREVADLLVKHWGRGRIVEAAEPDGPHEAHYLKLDSSKAAAELGWQALLSGEERLAWTVEWYKAWQDDPAAVWGMTAGQIERYERRMAGCAGLGSRVSPAPVARAA